MYASRDDLPKQYGDDPAFSRLSRFITDSLFELASEVNKPYWRQGQEIRIDVTGLWFQITNNFAFHETHVHGNCSWSGVYYVQAGESSDAADNPNQTGMPNGITRFYGPHMEHSAGGHGDLGNLYQHHATFDSVPEDGRLVIFPAYLKHMVFPYNGSTDRVIVSFHAQVNGPEGFRTNYAFS